ncbi:MAG TPA: hypothetical protein VMH90_03615 [Thermoplasmata archaeon]|nr:hypothetical protein [Thermoplasmata archaeon]
MTRPDRPTRPRRHEHDLRGPVTGFLTAQGYRVWADPDGRDYLDLVAARGDEVGLVELKIADWKTVRAQGVVRRALADWVAVALPSDGLARRLMDSTRGPVAPRLGVWVVGETSVVVRRPAEPLAPPPPGTPAAEARAGFRALVHLALDGDLPDAIRWGGSARRTGGGRSYRLDEFPSD